MALTGLMALCGRPFLQQLPDAAMVVVEEYKRATLAALHYSELKGRHHAALHGSGADGFPRQVFDAFYRH